MSLFSASMSAMTVNASDLDVKLQGRIEFTAGHFAPKGKEDYKYMSSNKKKTSFNSSTSIGAIIENQMDNGVVYGAKIGISATAKPSRKNPSFLYIVSDYGKLELGSNQSAMGQMKITGYSNAAAIGGGWDMWPRLNPDNSPEIPYLTGTGNYLDGKSRKKDHTEYPRKVTYFTPKFSGLQLGVSFVPDTSNLGFGDMNEHNVTTKAKIPGYSFAIKNAFAAGVTYERDLATDVKLRTSVTGEKGKVVAYDANDVRVTDKKFRNLSNYNVGAELKVKNTSLAGSYGNHRKSFTSDQVDTLSNKTDLYTIGARQNFGDAAVSFTFLKSSHRRNELSAGSLGAEYKMAPGLLPYVQWTKYITKAHYKTQATGEEKREKRRGQVVVVGAKLQF